MRYGSLVVFGWLAACKGGSDVVVDTDGDVTVDTGAPQDTDETDLPDTDEPAVWTDVSLSPGTLIVGVDATLTYRLVGTAPTGERATPDGVTWASSDPAVATVVAGVATAVAPGAITVTATWEGGEADAALIVDAEGTLEVRVVDAISGDALTGANVGVDELFELPVTDAAGFTTIDGVEGEPAAICAWATGYWAACATGVVGRRLVLPLRLRDETSDSGDLTGTCDASAVDASASEIVVGVVVPGLDGSPWWATLDDLLGPPRDVNVLGVDVSLPANVIVQGYADDWRVDAISGVRDLWVVAAAVPIADALAAGSGSKNPLTVLAERAGNGLWSQSIGFAVTAGAATDVGEVAPVSPFTTSVEVITGDLPAGTAGDEVALVLPLVKQPGGWIATGMGVGLVSVTAPVVGEPGATAALAIVQAGGFGSGGGQSVAFGEVKGARADLPPFAAIPALPVVRPTTDTLDLATDPSGQLVRLRMVDREFRERDLFAPAGAVSVGFPEIPPPLDRGRSEWNVRTIVIRQGHFEELLSTGSLTPDSLEAVLVGTSWVSGDVAASSAY